MTMNPLFRALNPAKSLRRALTQMRSNAQGIAAVEFALILPIMLLMYFGSAELTKGILVNRQVTLATHSMVDLLAQQNANITDTQITNIFLAGQKVMGSNASGLAVTLSSIKFVLHAGSLTIFDAKTMWSVTQSSNPLRPCTVLTPDNSTTLTPDVTKVPAGFYTGPGTILVADVIYTYPSPFNLTLPFYTSPPTLLFTRAYFNTPRNTSSIAYTGAGTVCP